MMKRRYKSKKSKSKKSTTVIGIIFIAIGLLLLIDTAILAFTENFNSGTILLGAIAVALCLIGLFWKRLSRVKWLSFSIIGAFLLLLTMILFLGIYGQRDNPTYNEDAVIVLGCGIDGEQVTSQLAGRLDRAVAYYSKNPDAIIVVSGGQGPQETISEALAMERYLINKGIPANNIIKEEKSTSTYTNLTYSKELLDHHFERPYKTALITSDFHIYRAANTGKKVGLEATHCHGDIPWHTIPMRYLRECAAVAKHWVTGS